MALAVVVTAGLLVALVLVLGSRAQPHQGGGGGGKEEGWALNFVSAVAACAEGAAGAGGAGAASSEFMDVSQLRVLQLNETTAAMDGAVHFLQGFPEDIMLEMSIEKVSGGRGQRVASHEICALCAEMTDPDSNYAGYLKYFGFPDLCPFPPGEYKVNQMVVETDDLPINSANAGEYQAVLVMSRAGDADCSPDKRTFLACLNLDFVIEKVL